MSVHLSATDIAGASRAVELLLTPLDHDSIDRWRSQVNRTLRELFGADSAGFILPGVDGPVVYSDEHDPAELAQYPEILPPPLPDGSQIFARAVALGPSTLPELWGSEFGSYLKSAYHNEFALANDADDALTMMIELEGDHPLPIAGLHFWHGRNTRRRFGERESALMRVVFPALRAGIETQLRWGRLGIDLLQALDCLEHPTAVYEASGKLLHMTGAMQSALTDEPERESLEQAFSLITERLRHAAGGSLIHQGRLPDCAAVGVSTGLASYEVRGSLYRSPLPHCRSLVLVALRRTTPILRTEDDLRARYGFTRAESRVAVHLVSSRSSAEIARDLCVTVHTVRRHTERILLKAKVRSRTELSHKLLR